MSFLINIKDKLLSRQVLRDYKTEEYTQDIDNNLKVSQFRKNWNPTGGLPSNGSGYDGSIRVGDFWNATSGSVIGGVNVSTGDWLIALVDNANSISDFVLKTSQTPGSFSGNITVQDGDNGVIEIGDIDEDLFIKVEVVLKRSSLPLEFMYMQTLDILIDESPQLYMHKGTITPYIAANPTLGFIFSTNISITNKAELAYENMAGLGEIRFYYKVTKIL